MTEQNYANHVRLHKIFHFGIMPLCIVGFIGSLINLTRASSGNLYDASLMALVFFILFNVAGLARMYALKAQDRAIRAEENFRHYLLAGKPLDSRLRMGQIIALRFASDAEFPQLVQRAANENLSPKQIKLEIKNWRGDHYRV
jgi:hypothetical protein